MRRAFATLAAGWAALAGTGAAPRADAAEVTGLAPHRAVYDITLSRSAPGSGVADLNGRMVYELAGSTCEGFTQNMRFVTRLTNREGEAQVSDLRTSSWEDAAGKRLRFNSSQYRDERLEDATQGDAGRAPGSATVRVELTKPEKKKIDLASGVYFPVQHTTALLASARDGRNVFLADLYDGSEKGDKVYQTSAFIGQRAPAGKVAVGKEADAAGVLDALPSWPIAISYYEPGAEKADALPAYELSFRLFDNGVSSRLFIDYGDFAIIGELKELKLLEVNECKH
ncbi:MAG: cell envelope integrity EipB family protein [Pseudomonadota bacterium]